MQIKINPETFFVFDLDDTLYHEIDFLKSAYRHISLKLEPLIRLELYDQMFAKYEQQVNVFQWILETYGKDIPAIDLAWLLNEYRTHQPQIQMSHDTADFLSKASGYGIPAGLITDGRSLTQRNKLKALGIETYFHDIIISEEFGSEKPDERNYLYFENKYPGREFYFFGDNLSKDFVVPRKLGWRTICITDSGNHIHKQIFNAGNTTDYRVSGFEEISLLKAVSN
jgi:putative hydrolase of the HAD superfamily